MRNRKKNTVRNVFIILTSLIIILGVAFFLYVSNYSHAGQEAKSAMETSKVTVTDFDGGVAFGNPNAKNGLIFYPGGKVEYTAYAPIIEEVAEGDIFCVIVKMPFNLAVFHSDAAAAILKKYEEVENWYIAGHSLGGAMAANYAAQHSDAFDGLILLAAYPTKDLSNSGLRVLSLYGSEDGVLNREHFEEGRSLMPDDYEEICIKGGNHGQFGDYGEQKGDLAANISAREQWKKTAQLILNFIN